MSPEGRGDFPDKRQKAKGDTSVTGKDTRRGKLRVSNTEQISPRRKKGLWKKSRAVGGCRLAPLPVPLYVCLYLPGNGKSLNTSYKRRK